MTIDLPNDLEGPIHAELRRGRFASASEVVAEAVRHYLRPDAPEAATPPAAKGESDATPHKPIWEVASEIRKSIPDVEWAKLPRDGAEQHDHYIYGTPKRPTA